MSDVPAARPNRDWTIPEPAQGWKISFTDLEKRKLRPVAETLAMLDGNAFFGQVVGGHEWYEGYLPEAHALYESNGGDAGWAGEASFARAVLGNETTASGEASA